MKYYKHCKIQMVDNNKKELDVDASKNLKIP